MRFLPQRRPDWQRSTNSRFCGTVSAIVRGAMMAVALSACGGGSDGGGMTAPPASVATVQVSLASPTLIEGTGTQATAVLQDASGTTLTGRTVVWTSSNTAVATVTDAGVVDAIAPGSSTITASSESRSGSAMLTVTSAVTIEDFALLDATGAALDVTNVAGEIEISLDPVVPSDFRGVIEVRIDTVLMAEDSIIGSSNVGSSLTALRASHRLSLNTAVVVTSLTADELRMQTDPKVLNGDWPLNVRVRGGYGVNRTFEYSKTTPITLRNPDAIRIWHERQDLILLNGKPVGSGSVNLFVQDLSFSAIPISRIEIVAANAQAIYGSNVANVVNIITQTGPDIGTKVTIPASALSFESTGAGTRYIVKSFTRGAQTFRTGDIISNSGNASSVDGSLLYNSPDKFTAPDGYRLTNIPAPPAGQVPATLRAAWQDPFFHDGLGPRPLAGAFVPPSRQTTIGQPAVSVDWKLGLSDNYLGVSTNLNDFVHADQFDDPLSGLDLDVPLTYYASTVRSSLFSDGNIISNVTDIPASLERNVFIGARVADRSGNYGYAVAGVTPANPFAENGDAKFGRLTSIGNLNVSGLRPGGIIGAYNFGSSKLSFEASGSLFSSNAIYGTVFKYGDPTSCYYGSGANCERPEVIGGTPNADRTSLTLDWSMGDVFSRRAQRDGGTGNGLFSGTYFAADLGGNVASGPYQSPGAFNFLIDNVLPDVSVTTAFPTASTVSVTMHASDNIGVALGEVGFFTDYPNPYFSGGYLFAPIYQFPLGTTLDDGALSTSATISWTDNIVTSGRFFNPNTGNIDANGFRVTGAYFGVYDFARNLRYASEGYTNTGAIEPPPPDISSITFALSSPSVCGGLTCAGGIPNTITAQVDVLTSTDVPPLTKATFMGLHPDGAPRYFGNTTTAERTPVTGGFNYRYEISYTPSADCIGIGPYLGKVMLIAKDGRQALFPNQFPFMTIEPPTTINITCDLPTRPLGGNWINAGNLRRP